MSFSSKSITKTKTIFNQSSFLFPPMAPPRILLCGDVNGRLNQLYKRVASVNKSAGPFDALLCVGQFFSDSPERLSELADYVEGRSGIPLLTYFVGDYGVGSAKFLLAASKDSANLGFKMDGLRICDNLFWLKGSGKFTLHGCLITGKIRTGQVEDFHAEYVVNQLNSDDVMHLYNIGLSVAYLSGRRSLEAQQFGTYSQDDVDALRAIAEEPGVVDLFLTNEWPSGVTNGASMSNIPPGMSESFGNDSTVAELVAEIKPRYHIAGTKGVFYDREPYTNVDAVHVTRFMGLAAVGNKDKQKFIHAISPTPASMMSAAEIGMKTTNTTVSPYTMQQVADENETAKRSNDSVSDSQYWRYDVSQKRQKHGAGDGEKMCFKFVSSGSCPRGDKCHFQHDMDAREQYMRGVCFDFINKGKCERGPDCNFKHSLQDEGERYSHQRRGSENASSNRSKECWFCLSSPNLESHLIISVGENLYCALPKGPLVQDHVLVIPVEHLPNTLSLPQKGEIDLGKFQNSLKKYQKNRGKEVVFFEWVSKRSTHANLQAIPVPSSKAAALQIIYNLAAEKLGFKFVTKKFNDNYDGRNYLKTQLDRKLSFFYVELPDGTILSHVVEENERFPAQFGREVLAGLLKMADRADWRNCTYSKEEETKMAGDLKSQFQEFDPNE